MKVVSTRMHFIGGVRVRPGQVFELPDTAKLKPYLTRVSDDAPAVKPVKAKQPKVDKAPETFSEIAKKDAADQTPKGA